MYDFNIILERLKRITGKTKNKEIAEILGTNEGNFSRWIGRNKIPYEQLTNLSLQNGYDLMYILTGKETSEIIKQNINSNNKNITINGDNNQVSNIKTDSKKLEIIEKIEKLPPKRQDYYYHVISAELLNLED